MSGAAFPSETRARAGARARGGEPEVPGEVPRVVAIEIPETSRRIALVMVAVAVGPLTLSLGVVLTRAGNLEIRPPVDMLDGPGVTASPALLEAIKTAALGAVCRDRAAMQHLNYYRYRRNQAASAAYYATQREFSAPLEPAP